MISSPFVANGVLIATPSDTLDIGVGAVGFRVRGDAGDVAIMLNTGLVVTIPNCLVGEDFPINFSRIMETDTTATDILVFTP